MSDDRGNAVVLVDGPGRGQVRHLMDEHVRRFELAVPRPLACWPAPESPYEPAFDVVTYHIRRLEILGRRILIGSTGLSPPGNFDLFDVLLSDAAKAAAQRKDAD